jgi:hypothetical protein
MTKRKTVDLNHVVEKANQYLLNTPDDDRNGRRAIHSFVSTLLMDAKAYLGFGYLDADDMAKSANGKTPGIARDPTGGIDHQFPDDSRTRFYKLPIYKRV